MNAYDSIIHENYTTQALVYTRVSHEEQVKYGYSLDAQKDALVGWAKDNHIPIKGIYTDEGISGASLDKRDAFKKMINDATNGDIIIFTKLDRFSRNLLDANIIVKDLEKKGVAIKAINEDDIDTSTADGRFIFNLKLSLAQRERDKTAERVKEVMDYKRRNGEVASGSVPLGYRIVDKKPVIEPQEAEIVRFIFETYDRVNNIQETYRQVNAKYGRVRTISSYRNILSCQTYIGLNSASVAFCEPIIDEAMFKRVQHKLSRNVKRAPSGTIYLFSGLLICPTCGHKLYGHRYNKNDKNIRYHCCSRNLKYGGNCGYGSIHESKVEEQLLNTIKDFADQKKHYFKRTNEKAEDTKKAMQALEGKLTRLKELYIDGDIAKASYLKRKEALERDLSELDQLYQEDEKGAINEILALNVKELYQILSKKGKSEFWHRLIEKIIINDDNQVTDIIFASNVVSNE